VFEKLKAGLHTLPSQTAECGNGALNIFFLEKISAPRREYVAAKRKFGAPSAFKFCIFILNNK
jgi:hypothetical protein